MKKMMNRVVRDYEPDILRQNGVKVHVRELDTKEMISCLEGELLQTVQEYTQNKDYEKLVDVLEMVYTLAEKQGISKDELERTRGIKAIARGTFEKNYFVEYVEEDGGKKSIDWNMFTSPMLRGGSVEEYMNEMREDRPTPYEMAEGMRQYLEELKKNPSKEKCMQDLIRTGVLDQNGCPKEQICTGGYYLGR